MQQHVFGGGGLTVERQTGGTIAYFKNTGTTTPNIAFQASGTTYTPYIGVNNDDLLFGTGSSGLERVRLDSSGRVTMPYQPSFQAFSSSNTPIGSGTNVLPFNATNFNVGSHYNTSTYRFTAPVAGKYLFTVNFNAYTLDDTAKLNIALQLPWFGSDRDKFGRLRLLLLRACCG